VVDVTLADFSLSAGTFSAMVKLLQYFPNLQQLELLTLVPLTVHKELEGLNEVLTHLSRLSLSEDFIGVDRGRE